MTVAMLTCLAGLAVAAPATERLGPASGGASFAAALALAQAQEQALTANVTDSKAAVPIVWPCRSPDAPVRPATSVHALRPENVQVIGALGDSITAGFGANAENLLQLPTE